MICTLKETITIVTLISICISCFAAVKYYHKSQKEAIKNQKEETDKLKSVLFKSTGGLNLVDNATYAQHRIDIQEKIAAESEIVKRLFVKLDTVDENIIIIMGHLNITEKRQKGYQNG